MSAQCTAPKTGHIAGGAANCPVHGKRPITRPDHRAAVPAPVQPERQLTPAEMAESSTAAPATLRKLSSNLDSQVRTLVALNPNTPVGLLTELSEDAASLVRGGVAENPNASPETLVLLSKDRDIPVRTNTADNPSTPRPTLVRLAADPYWEVRMHAASNERTPIEAFLPLLTDEDEEVRGEAAACLPDRIGERLGINPSNKGAIDMLRDQEWWGMGADDPAVILARTLYPNA